MAINWWISTHWFACQIIWRHHINCRICNV